MEINKCRKFIWIMTIIFILINILTLIFTIWTSKALGILSYICSSIIIIYYIYILLIENDLDINILKKLREYPIKVTYCICCISLLFTFFELIILLINVTKFSNFWRNCPFIISDLDYNLHLNRRCELYNINNNSRYSYQYICSYDPSKEFDNKFKQEIKPEKIICNQVKTLIPDNNIISLFNDEYSEKKKYYCSRTDMPKDYSFAKHKDCKQIKYNVIITFYMLSLVQIFFIYIYIKYLRRKNVINRRRILDFGFRPRDHPRRNIEEIQIRNLLNLGRLINLIRDLINININVVSSSNCSTEVSENQNENDNNNNNNIEENIKNIIIENKKEIIIEEDINNYSPDKKKQINNPINLEQIQVSFDINSEEVKIENQYDNNNINNINNINNQ